MSHYAKQLKALHDAMVHKQLSEILALVNPTRTADITADQRLAVYADGYDTRLIDVTLADYPALAHYMGAGSCRVAIAAFVAATPSRHWDLNKYPVAFAEYLARHAADPAAHAIAALESAIANVFWLPESAALTPEALAGLSEEAFAAQHFTLRTAAQLLVLDYAAHDYLTAFREGAAPDSIDDTAQYLLVIRNRNAVQREVLEKPEYELLAALQAGLTFGDAVANISNQEQLAERLPDYIARWFAGGFMQNNAA
jgi:hypothetical protein